MWYEINHIMFMIDRTCCDMYTTNCQVSGTKSSRNSTRCRKHERTSTYTAVRDFPFIFWRRKNCTVWYALKMIPGTARYVIRNQPHDVHDRSHMMWYVYQELPDMWYEINHMMFMTDLTWCDMWHEVWYQDLSRTKRRELSMLYKFGAICLNREWKIADPRYVINE